MVFHFVWICEQDAWVLHRQAQIRRVQRWNYGIILLLSCKLALFFHCILYMDYHCLKTHHCFLVEQDEKYNQMKQYMPVKKPIYMREFPISWRDIDVGIEELHQLASITIR